LYSIHTKGIIYFIFPTCNRTFTKTYHSDSLKLWSKDLTVPAPRSKEVHDPGVLTRYHGGVELGPVEVRDFRGKVLECPRPHRLSVTEPAAVGTVVNHTHEQMYSIHTYIVSITFLHV